MQDEASPAFRPSLASSPKTADQSVSPASLVTTEEPPAKSMTRLASSPKTADQSVSPASLVTTEEPPAKSMTRLASSPKTADQSVSPASLVTTEEPPAKSMTRLASSPKTADQSVSPASLVTTEEPPAKSMTRLASSPKTADQSVSPASLVTTEEPPAKGMTRLASSPKTADQSVSPASLVTTEEPPAKSMTRLASSPKTADQSVAPASLVTTEEPPAKSMTRLASSPKTADQSVAPASLVTTEEPPAESMPGLASSPKTTDQSVSPASLVTTEEPPAEIMPGLASSPKTTDQSVAPASLVTTEEPPAKSMTRLASSPKTADQSVSPASLVTTEEPPAEKMAASMTEFNMKNKQDKEMHTSVVSISPQTACALSPGNLPHPSMAQDADNNDAGQDMPGSSSFIGTVVAIYEGVEDDVYAMCNDVLAIGSAKSNDIIVPDAADHHVMLQASRYGEVVLFHQDLNFREGRNLGHDDTFRVGTKLFKWKYPQEPENEENDKDSDYEPGSELIQSDSDNSIEDKDFKMNESDESYISDDSYVSDSDNSVVVPFQLPLLKTNLQTTCGRKHVKTKKKDASSDDCEISHGNKQKEDQHFQSNKEDRTVESPNNKADIVKLQPSRNTGEKRVWDKLHYCVYCEKSFTNITKHLLRRHKNEKDVVEINNLPLQSKGRKDLLLKLRNAGDFNHNFDILKSGNGTLVTFSRKEGSNHLPTDYLPCEDCLAFFSKETLWKHRKNCVFRKGDDSKRKVQSAASFMLPVARTTSEGLKENVLKKMVLDDISLIVRNDSLILKVGDKLFEKHGQHQHLSTYISQKMRELGRLVAHARQICPDIQYLTDIIVPARFSDVAIAATRSLCKYNEKTNAYENPSLAMKLGHLLKKCARIKKSHALISGNEMEEKNADGFFTLLENDWTDAISSRALQTLKENKITATEAVIPLTEDIMTLQRYLKSTTSTLVESLGESFTKQDYDELNQITLARVVLFNRRRGGETQRLTLKAYQSKLSTPSTPDEIEESFSPVEKMMVKTFSRIQIRGKKGRTVPVLITPEIEHSIEVLLTYREKAGVHADNEYLFARTNFDSLSPIRSTDVLRKYAVAANLKNPKSITSTKLRKHVATVSQIINLSRHDMETVAEFMGHDLDVHRTFYRLPQETLQVVKMGKLLSAFDKGSVGQYRGMTLDEIPFEKETPLTSEDEYETESEDDEGLNETVQAKELSIHVDSDHNGDDDGMMEPLQKMKKTSSEQISGRKIQKLTSQQSQLLHKLFSANITFRRELKMIDCTSAMKKYKCLENLPWTKIKNTVHNWITADKRRVSKSAK